MTWSGFGHTDLVRKQAGVQESSGPVSGRTQLVHYQFPTFRLDSVLPQTSRIILCKTSPDPIWFWLTVSGLGQTDPVRKQAIVQESSGPLLANASQPSRTGCELDPACLLDGALNTPILCGIFYAPCIGLYILSLTHSCLVYITFEYGALHIIFFL